MKKIFIVLMLALLLVGCGKHDANITNKDDVIWTENGHNFTSKDLFEELKSQDYTPIIIRNIVSKIAEFENVDLAKVKESADNDVQQIVNTYGDYYFQYYGTTKEEYAKSYYSKALLTELMKIYANESFDSLVEEYVPYLAEVAYFDDLELAKTVVNDVRDGEHTFAYSCEENGFTEEVTSKVYTDLSDLPLEVKDYVLNSSNIGLSDVIQSSRVATDSEGNSSIIPRYYIINLTSKNADEFKDEFINYLITEVFDSNEILSKFMTKYNVKVYDQRTYELLNNTYGDFH